MEDALMLLEIQIMTMRCVMRSEDLKVFEDHTTELTVVAWWTALMQSHDMPISARLSRESMLAVRAGK